MLCSYIVPSVELVNDVHIHCYVPSCDHLWLIQISRNMLDMPTFAAVMVHVCKYGHVFGGLNRVIHLWVSI